MIKKINESLHKDNETTNHENNSILNNSYTFDSFIVGKSNEMAYKVLIEVSNKLDNPYNPIFIYGKTGVGKSHLLHAIEKESKKNEKIVIYITIEQFKNDFISSIKTNDMEYFRNKYRKYDVLLIDDIQFLSGKEQAQVEFFHILNELCSTKKQIIITSDRLPSQIAGLASRLKSRFECSLTINIKTPKCKTKISFIEKKIQINNILLSKDIINYIVDRLSSIREIEGLLLTINASAYLLNKKINLKFVKSLIKEQYMEIK